MSWWHAQSGAGDRWVAMGGGPSPAVGVPANLGMVLQEQRGRAAGFACYSCPTPSSHTSGTSGVSPSPCHPCGSPALIPPASPGGLSSCPGPQVILGCFSFWGPPHPLLGCHPQGCWGWGVQPGACWGTEPSPCHIPGTNPARTSAPSLCFPFQCPLAGVPALPAAPALVPGAHPELHRR